MNALQLCRWQFSHKETVADFLQAKCNFRGKTAVLLFWTPLGDLRETYDDHLRLIGKHIMDFLLVLIELFCARCYGWGATSDYRFKISDFAPTGVGWPKISGRRGRPHHSFFFYQKTRINALSYGIKIWTDFSFVLSQSTCLADGWTDRQMDRILITRPRLHSMQHAKNDTMLKTIHCTHVTCFRCTGVHGSKKNLPPNSSDLSLVNSSL